MSEVKDITVVDDKPQIVNADLRKFNKSEEMIAKALATLAVIMEVKDSAECDAALVTLKEAKSVENAIEKKRTELVKPFNEAVKKINAYAKGLVVKLPLEIDRVKKAVVAFQHEEQRLAAEERKTSRIQQLEGLGFTKNERGYTHASGCLFSEWSISNMSDDQWTADITEMVALINEDSRKKLAQKQSELEEVSFFGTEEEVAELGEAIQQLQVQETLLPPVMSVGQAATAVKGITRRWKFEVTDETLVPREYLIVDEKKVREAIATGTRTIAGVRIYQDESLTIR